MGGYGRISKKLDISSAGSWGGGGRATYIFPFPPVTSFPISTTPGPLFIIIVDGLAKFSRGGRKKEKKVKTRGQNTQQNSSSSCEVEDLEVAPKEEITLQP